MPYLPHAARQTLADAGAWTPPAEGSQPVPNAWFSGNPADQLLDALVTYWAAEGATGGQLKVRLVLTVEEGDRDVEVADSAFDAGIDVAGGVATGTVYPFEVDLPGTLDGDGARVIVQFRLPGRPKLLRVEGAEVGDEAHPGDFQVALEGRA